jgi:hypothetical protein
MGDPTCKRTSRYRNWINRRCWMPMIRKGIAVMVDGQQYEGRNNGWREQGIKTGGLQ